MVRRRREAARRTCRSWQDIASDREWVPTSSTARRCAWIARQAHSLRWKQISVDLDVIHRRLVPSWVRRPRAGRPSLRCERVSFRECSWVRSDRATPLAADLRIAARLWYVIWLMGWSHGKGRVLNPRGYDVGEPRERVGAWWVQSSVDRLSRSRAVFERSRSTLGPHVRAPPFAEGLGSQRDHARHPAKIVRAPPFAENCGAVPPARNVAFELSASENLTPTSHPIRSRLRTHAFYAGWPRASTVVRRRTSGAARPRTRSWFGGSSVR